MQIPYLESLASWLGVHNLIQQSITSIANISNWQQKLRTCWNMYILHSA